MERLHHESTRMPGTGSTNPTDIAFVSELLPCKLMLRKDRQAADDGTVHECWSEPERYEGIIESTMQPCCAAACVIRVLSSSLSLHLFNHMLQYPCNGICDWRSRAVSREAAALWPPGRSCPIIANSKENDCTILPLSTPSLAIHLSVHAFQIPSSSPRFLPLFPSTCSID